MSIYDAAKDALKLAQKLDDTELIQKILDVQSQALEMQEKQFTLNKRIDAQDKEIAALKEKKKYIYEQGHTWMIDPESPSRKLCPVCLNRDSFENPLEGQFCRTCKKYAE